MPDEVLEALAHTLGCAKSGAVEFVDIVNQRLLSEGADPVDAASIAKVAEQLPGPVRTVQNTVFMLLDLMTRPQMGPAPVSPAITVDNKRTSIKNGIPASGAMEFTDEQMQVISHPRGTHARVLAVAGSGKTTTMVHRIKYLVEKEQVNPQHILVLMFNRLARDQFASKLDDVGLGKKSGPKLYTFHSFAYNFISWAQKRNLLDNQKTWIGDREEESRLALHRVIDQMRKDDLLDEEDIDVSEAETAISLWKGSLIPPERAGYRGNELMPEVYKRYETFRVRESALTFDDFVPTAIGLLERHADVREQWCAKVDFLIVDEYQDVNYGQQKLIELLAGDRADVMVVGDDDQTIYEWRGARPSYIIRGFGNAFSGKPNTELKLTNSFRFGPLIAQAAFNTISFNTNRVPKRLIAHFPRNPASINLHRHTEGVEVDKALASEVISLTKAHNVSPTQVIVLGRTYAQLSSIQSEFLVQKIPFRVEGSAPFFDRPENKSLLDYAVVAVAYHNPLTTDIRDRFLGIANKPNRFLTKKVLGETLGNAIRMRASLHDSLHQLAEAADSPFSNRQQERLRVLMEALQTAYEMIQDQQAKAGVVLRWISDNIEYSDHFENYYGHGEKSIDRQNSIEEFLSYADAVQFEISEFVDHLDHLDPTQGFPPDQQIVMTTVFKTKGLEYDHVIIPSCQEGYMPCLYGTAQAIFDTENKIATPELSEMLESERRLFYVALTRARKSVSIGVIGSIPAKTPPKSTKGLPSRFLDEIELPVLQELFGEFGRVVNEGDEHGYGLIKLVQKYNSHHKIVSPLKDIYVTSLPSRSLQASIRGIPQANAERPFRYEHAYQTDESKQKNDPKPEQHEVWSHIEL